jgi:hypothetical protein
MIESMERFEVWFGALFLVLGLIALGIAGVLYLAFGRDPRMRLMRWAFLAAPLGIGVIFSLIGAGFMGYGLWEVQTERHILANGTSVRATVLQPEQTYTRVNGRYLWRVRYQYVDQTGRAHEGSSGLMSNAEALTWRPGDQAFVRYDPARPSSSVWLGHEDRVGGPDTAPSDANTAGGQHARIWHTQVNLPDLREVADRALC